MVISRQHFKTSISTCLEVIFLMLLIPVIGFFINERDPFMLNQYFPWVLAPLTLVLLRYGLTISVFSLSLYFTFYYLMMTLLKDELAISLSSVMIFSHYFFLIVVGLYADSMIRKSKELRSAVKAYEMKFNRLDLDYALLKSSHDHLQAHAATHCISLKDKLEHFSRRFHLRFSQSDQSSLLSEMIASLLDIFSQFEFIQQASIYKVDGHHISEKSENSKGKAVNLHVSDPLIIDAIKYERITYQNLQPHKQVKDAQHAAAPMVVPISDSDQKVWAIIVIYEIDLLAIHTENLEILSYLGRFCGDLLHQYYGDVRYEN